MKIINAVKVLVFPQETIGEALGVCLGKSVLKKLDFADRKLPWGESPETKAPYEKTMALAVLEKNYSQKEVCSSLKEAGFYPAGLNQTAHYIKKARDGSEKNSLGAVIVLGMRILDDECKEVHLVIKKDGVEQEIAYPEKPIKQHFRIVAVKEEAVLKK